MPWRDIFRRWRRRLLREGGKPQQAYAGNYSRIRCRLNVQFFTVMYIAYQFESLLRVWSGSTVSR